MKAAQAAIPPPPPKPRTFVGRLDALGRRVFYDGPALFNYPGRKMVGYRSPTVILWIWLKSWALSWFTGVGRIMLALTVMIGMTGIMSDLMPVYFLSFMLAGLFIVDFVVGWFFRPRLLLERRLPPTAVAGVPFRAAYNVTPVPGSGIAWGIHIDTVPPPLHMQFVDDGVQLGSPPEAEVQLERWLLARRRGRYFLPLAVADSAFPFGLWRWGVRAPHNSPVLVFPAYQPLTSLRIPRRGGAGLGGESASMTTGDSTQFLSCREYRYGDSTRHLHAPGWARLGTPVVKEFSHERSLQVALVVDLRGPGLTLRRYLEREMLGRADHTFEAQMSLCAAILEAVMRQGGSAHLYIPQWQGEPIIPGSDEPLRELLSVLTILEPVSHKTPLSFTPAAAAGLRAATGIFSVSSIGDSHWQDLNRTICDRPEGLSAIHIGRPLPDRPAVTCLSVRDILAGSVRDIH